jgi:hypothetical protein
MPHTSENDLVKVSEALEPIGMEYAFGGGAIVGLLIHQTPFYAMRPTDDVDVIAPVITGQPYSDMEEKIRKQGFLHDMSPGAPKCRWLYEGIKVDIMPSDDPTSGLNTKWFPEALKTACLVEVRGKRIPIISASAFITTKYEAFMDRGKNDYLGSHDLEDIICVVDHRESLLDELRASKQLIDKAAVEALVALWKNPKFREALPGHLPSDSASQMRLELLEKKLSTISRLREDEKH